jgi:hypothetical protein
MAVISAAQLHRLGKPERRHVAPWNNSGLSSSRWYQYHMKIRAAQGQVSKVLCGITGLETGQQNIQTGITGLETGQPGLMTGQQNLQPVSKVS